MQINTDDPPDITVREASDRDIEVVLDCLTCAFAPYRAQYTPETFADTVLTGASLERRRTEMCVFVAVHGPGEVIGTIACADGDDGEGHIRGMAVRPTWQGRGASVALLHAAEAELWRRGCARITLDTTEPLTRAMSFYAKQGFQRSGRVVNFFGMPLIEYFKDRPPRLQLGLP